MSGVGPGPDAKTNFRRKVVLTVCLIAAVGVSVFASLYRWHNGVDAQNQSVRAMFAIVEHYVNTHEGDWPKNWNDLETLEQSDKWHVELDYETVKKYVIIDFDASPEVLARQSPSQFKAIDAKTPVFDFSKDPRLSTLLASLKKYHVLNKQKQ